jgi:hypothetical protein
MTDKLVFIADYYADEIPGGGELNNQELIFNLNKKYNILCLKSNNVKELKSLKNCKFIIANFALLSEEIKQYLINTNQKYVIYEHDHKYLKSRNPADYKNFKAPEEHLINVNFYKNAKHVFCQSKFHKSIIEKNLKISNIISLSGNLWSDQILETLKIFSEKSKKDCCSIMQSNNWHKNTLDSINYCEQKKIYYELIPNLPYEEFLNRLSNNNKLVFFPKTPETLSRIAVEARMMNMSVITNSNLGAASEDWFSLKGLELIDHMHKIKKNIINTIESSFD